MYLLKLNLIKMKKILASILIVSFFLGNSQDIEFGKVTKTELKEAFNPQDSTANATILYRKETINFSYNGVKWIQKRDVHVRVKIYNNDGFSWATDKIILFHNDYNEEKIKNLEGATYNLINGEVEKKSLDKSGIFEEKITKNLKSISFTFPNVKKMSIVDYKYSVSSPFYSIDDVELQFTIPVKILDVYISTHKNLKYNKILNPKSNYQPTIEYPGLSNNKGFQTNYDRVVKITENNIPALKKEPFSGNINNYKATLGFEIAGTLTNSGGLSRDISASWEKISKDFSENKWFGEQAKKKSVYKKELNILLNEVNKEAEIIDKIETFIKSKVKWNGFYGRYAQKGVREAYLKGEGNVADINLLAVSMLRSRGFNANPVLISTRNNGVPLFPTDDGLNYVICMVEVNGNNILLDATERLAPNLLLPERVLNWQGLVILDDGTHKWVNLSTRTKSIKASSIVIKINKDASVSGKVRRSMTSYAAYNYRKEYADLNNEEHLRSIESEKGDIEVSDLEYLNKEEVDKPVMVTYTYVLSDGVDEIGDKLYFSPLFFLATKESPFKLEERKYPIDFVIPFADKYKVNIMLPEGYKVESLPESGAMEYKGGEAKFTYVAKVNGKYLQLSVQLEINNPIIQPIDYKDFKEFFNKTIEKQAEQIVLTKA
ncbi:hypothetical protein FBALC1_14412 [Flavobacteriales bacterium ALC-1]|nr:hypothetical protein FBALC1_14412 [Flavobacteriales bacterium ALC-1]